MRRLLAAFAALLLLVVGTVVLLAYVRGADARALAGVRTVRGPGRRAARSPRGPPADQLADLVRTELVPAKTAVDGRVTDLADLAGQVATVDILPGEQLLAGRFASPDDLTRAGHRRRARGRLQEVSVLLEPQRAVGGRLAAGDNVGVVVSHDAPDGTAGHPRRPARGAGHPGAGRPGAGRPRPAGRRRRRRAGTAAPSASLMVTLAVSAAQAEAVVFGVEHGTLWLSLEPDGADTGGHRTSSPRTTSTEGRSHEPRRARRSRRGPDPAGQAGRRRRRPRPAARAACPPTRRGCSSSCSTASCPTSSCIGPGASPDAVLTLAARLDIQSPGHQRRPHRPRRRSRCGRPRCGRASATCCRRRPTSRRSATRSTGRRWPRTGAAACCARSSETERYTGRVITIASPKGGVGKTTVSTNLAIGLTAAAPQSTVLVDLDVQFGDVASALEPGARVHAARRRPRPGQRGHDGPQDLPHPAPERPLRRLRRRVAGRRRHRARRGRHPAARRCWRGSSATSSSTPHPGCPSRRWPRSTAPPTSSC